MTKRNIVVKCLGCFTYIYRSSHLIIVCTCIYQSMRVLTHERERGREREREGEREREREEKKRKKQAEARATRSKSIPRTNVRLSA